MQTTDTNETPKRRLEDHTPDATIDWTAPGAPAVPLFARSPSTANAVSPRFVASMLVDGDGVSVFPTEAAKRLPNGHYVLSTGTAAPTVVSPLPRGLSDDEILQLATENDIRVRLGVVRFARSLLAAAARPAADAQDAAAIPAPPAPAVTHAGSAVPTDLDKLEALARAADQGEGQHIYTHWRDSNNHKANEAWHLAASPAAVLELIAIARRVAQPVEAAGAVQAEQPQSSHFDLTDEYVAVCGRAAWANAKSVELAERAARLRREGKLNDFTLLLRSFIIHAQFYDKEMLSKVMLAWRQAGPFHSSAIKAEIKKLMGEGE